MSTASDTSVSLAQVSASSRRAAMVPSSAGPSRGGSPPRGKAAQIHVFDNSTESPGGAPAAQLVFRMRGAKLVEPDLQTLLTHGPEWAKPVAAAALRAGTPARSVRAKKKR